MCVTCCMSFCPNPQNQMKCSVIAISYAVHFADHSSVTLCDISFQVKLQHNPSKIIFKLCHFLPTLINWHTYFSTASSVLKKEFGPLFDHIRDLMCSFIRQNEVIQIMCIQVGRHTDGERVSEMKMNEWFMDGFSLFWHVSIY